MNKLTTINSFLLACFALTVIPAACNAQDMQDAAVIDNPDGPLWKVSETNIPEDENLIWAEDEMRLLRAPKDDPKHYMLKPEKTLSGRWGQRSSYRAKLTKSELDDRVYCGEIVVRYGGKKIKHKLALSEITVDEHVTLYFYPPGGHEEVNAKDGCSFHETHGGLAHVHNIQ